MKMNETVNTSTVLDEGEVRNSVETGLIATLLILVLLTAVIGNMAVIFAIGFFRALRKDVSNVLLINLGITDLSSALLVISSSVTSVLYDGWPLGDAWCDITCALNYLLIIVSMLTLCLISLDRHQAVLHPFEYPERVTRKRLYIAIVYAWCQGFVFASIPPFLHWVEYDYWEAICAIQWHRQRQQAIYYVVAAFAICFLGPGIVLVYCYVKILKEVKKQKAQILAIPTGVMKDQKRKKHNQNTRIVWSLMVVVLAYFVCTTPFSLTKLIKVSANQENILPGYVNLTAAVMAFLASAINPLIYGIFRRDFREAYKKILQMFFIGQQWNSTLEEHVHTFNTAEALIETNSVQQNGQNGQTGVGAIRHNKVSAQTAVMDNIENIIMEKQDSQAL